MTDVASKAFEKLTFLNDGLEELDLFDSFLEMYMYQFKHTPLSNAIRSLAEKEADVANIRSVITAVGEKARKMCSSRIAAFCNKRKLNVDHAFRDGQMPQEARHEDIVGLAKILAELQMTRDIANLWPEVSTDDKENEEETTRAKSEIDRIVDANRAIERLCLQLTDTDALKKMAKANGIIQENTSYAGARTDGVLTSSEIKSLGQITAESYLRSIEELFERMENRKFPLDKMTELSTVVPPNFIVDNALIERAVNALAIAAKEVDIRVKHQFLPVFKTLYLHADDDQHAMEYVFGHPYFMEQPGGVPNFKELYKKFDEDRTDLLQRIPAPNDLTDSVVASLARELGFLLIIAPKPTIRQVLLHSIQSLPLIPSVMRILRRLPAFNKLRVEAWGKPYRREILYLTLCRRLCNVDFKDNLDSEMGKNIANLLLNLTKTRLKDTGTDGPRVVLEEPIIDATEYFRDFLIDQLLYQLNVKFHLDFLQKVFSTSKTGDWVFKWKRPEDAEDTKSIDPCLLIAQIIKLYIALRKDQSDEVSATPIVLQQLATKLKADAVTLPSVEEVLCQCEIAEWTLKYRVTSYLKDVIDPQYKLQIPFALYETVLPAKQANYEPILPEHADATPEMTTQDFYRYILELALDSSEMALEFVRADMWKKPTRQSVVTELAFAFMKLAQEKKCTETQLTAVKPFFEQLLITLSAPLNDFAIDIWSETVFKLARTLSPISIYSEAARTYALESANPQEPDITLPIKNMVEAFGNIAKKFITENVTPILTAESLKFAENGVANRTETEVVAALNILNCLRVQSSILMKYYAANPTILSKMTLLQNDIAKEAKKAQKNIYGNSLEEPVKTVKKAATKEKESQANVEKENNTEKESNGHHTPADQHSERREKKLSHNRAHERNNEQRMASGGGRTFVNTSVSNGRYDATTSLSGSPPNSNTPAVTAHSTEDGSTGNASVEPNGIPPSASFGNFDRGNQSAAPRSFASNPRGGGVSSFTPASGGRQPNAYQRTNNTSSASDFGTTAAYGGHRGGRGVDTSFQAAPYASSGGSFGGNGGHRGRGGVPASSAGSDTSFAPPSSFAPSGRPSGDPNYEGQSRRYPSQAVSGSNWNSRREEHNPRHGNYEPANARFNPNRNQSFGQAPRGTQRRGDQYSTNQHNFSRGAHGGRAQNVGNSVGDWNVSASTESVTAWNSGNTGNVTEWTNDNANNWD